MTQNLFLHHAATVARSLGQGGVCGANPVSVKRQEMSIPYNELLVKPCFVSPSGDENEDCSQPGMSFMPMKNKGNTILAWHVL